LSDKSFDASSYQLGGVWPHDTLECLRGLWSAGEKETALKLARALGELAVRFDYRLPELIGGHPRSGDDIVAYFKGCSPQAWSASIPFALYAEPELRQALKLSR
jgi:glycogen debranching enzyme